MQARALTIRLVRLAMAASLLFPCLLFAFACWNSYRSLKALTDERLVRSLDVQQEEALKTFELVDMALNTTFELIAGMSDADICRRRAPTACADAASCVAQIPAVQSIWIFDQRRRGAGFLLDPSGAADKISPIGIIFRLTSTATAASITVRSTSRLSTRSRSLP